RMSRRYRFMPLSKMGFLYRIHGKNRSADDQHAARTIQFLTTKNADLRNYLNFVWALLQFDLATAFKRFSLLNLDLISRTFLRRCQILFKGRTPVTISMKRQKKVLQLVARSYVRRLWDET